MQVVIAAKDVFRLHRLWHSCYSKADTYKQTGTKFDVSPTIHTASCWIWCNIIQSTIYWISMQS